MSEVVKVPKKRGRKPKPKTENEVIKVPKKRGRKPKPKTEKDNEVKVTKKRGRRKKCDIDSLLKISGYNASGNSIDTNGDKLTFDNKSLNDNNIKGEKIPFGKFNIGIQHCRVEDNQLLSTVKLKTSEQRLCKIDIPDDGNESDEEKDNREKMKQIFNDSNLSYKKKQAASVILPSKSRNRPKNRSLVWNDKPNEDLTLALEQFRGEKNETVIWPEKTDICCWWCCHKFEGSPKSLPYSWDEMRDRYKVMGVFCSWSCSRSYSNNDNTLTSRFMSSILFSFTKKIYGKIIRIPCAPPRQSLKMFGGKLSIEEFRKVGCAESKYYEVEINKVSTILDPTVYFIWKKYNT
jgi:hypothetical protein